MKKKECSTKTGSLGSTLSLLVLAAALPAAVVVASAQQQGAAATTTTNTTTNNNTNATTTTSSGGGISIVSHSLMEDSLGSINIIGEIRNDYTDRDIGATFVDAKFYDSTGQLVHIERTLGGFFNIQPGQRAPFIISISDQSIIDKMANYTLTAEQESLPLGNLPAALRVEIVSQGLEQAPYGPQYKILGKVINTGSGPSTGTSVLATFYDSAGKIIDYQESSTVSPSTIPPGQSADFIIEASVDNYYYSNRTAADEMQSIVASVDVIALSSEYLTILEP